MMKLAMSAGVKVRCAGAPTIFLASASAVLQSWQITISSKRVRPSVKAAQKPPGGGKRGRCADDLRAFGFYVVEEFAEMIVMGGEVTDGAPVAVWTQDLRLAPPAAQTTPVCRRLAPPHIRSGLVGMAAVGNVSDQSIADDEELEFGFEFLHGLGVSLQKPIYLNKAREILGGHPATKVVDQFVMSHGSACGAPGCVLLQRRTA
jgi:hypothetical protein